jgi:hypothetical protein
MVDPIINEPTPAQNGGKEQEETKETEESTPEIKAEQPFKAFATKKDHDDYINGLIKDRLKREREKFADYEDLKAKADRLKKFEDKDLTDADKILQNYEEATGKVKELTVSLTNVQLENAKLKALIKAGALPDQLDGLLKRVAGSNEDEVIADVEELKTLGWIGKVPEPDLKPTKPTGLGSPTKTGEATKKVSLKDQLHEVNAKLSDPKLPHREKEDLMKQSIKLNRLIQKGET